MPSHWTYGDFGAADDLFQGDIISRSNELVGMLRGVFPYFCDERYIGFLVTTQSCDLVRRGTNPCKAKYISLAVIREVRPLLPEMLEELCGTGVRGIYKKESRFVAEQLLVRIINQNEQARGVFYLHPDADAGIATPSVALLRVTFSLRRQHYDLLMDSRCGRMQGEFANKLGWLSGNLFSRVATPDWNDQEGDTNAASKQAKQLLRFITEPIPSSSDVIRISPKSTSNFTPQNPQLWGKQFAVSVESARQKPLLPTPTNSETSTKPSFGYGLIRSWKSNKASSAFTLCYG